VERIPTSMGPLNLLRLEQEE